MNSDSKFPAYAEELADIARWAYRNGWAPGTSTNYSVRLHAEAGSAVCAITSSGTDKSILTADHILTIDHHGRPIDGRSLTPSAEAGLHLMLYRTTEAGAVLHTHSMAATIVSQAEKERGQLTLSGWELLRGLDGVHSHEYKVVIPIFPNSQDIPALAALIEAHLAAALPCYGFLLAGHGLYVWGKDLPTAKRHLEVFEFLLQCEREVRSHGNPAPTRQAYIPHE